MHSIISIGGPGGVMHNHYSNIQLAAFSNAIETNARCMCATKVPRPYRK